MIEIVEKGNSVIAMITPESQEERDMISNLHKLSRKHLDATLPFEKADDDEVPFKEDESCKQMVLPFGNEEKIEKKKKFKLNL